MKYLVRSTLYTYRIFSLIYSNISINKSSSVDSVIWLQTANNESRIKALPT